MPVLDHVGDARGRAAVVFQNLEAAQLVAHQVGAVDVHVGAVGHVDAAHLRAIVLVAQDQLGRNHAVAEDLLVVIDVLQEEVDGGDPLGDAGLDGPPVLLGDDPRDHVERQDAVDGVLLAVDREGDAEAVVFVLGVLGAGPQLLQAHSADALPELRRMFGRLFRPAQHLAEEVAGVVVLGKVFPGRLVHACSFRDRSVSQEAAPLASPMRAAGRGLHAGQDDKRGSVGRPAAPASSWRPVAERRCRATAGR